MTPEIYMMVGMLIAFTSVAIATTALYVMQRHISPNPTYDVPQEDKEQSWNNQPADLSDLYMLIHDMHDRLKALETANKPARKPARKAVNNNAKNLN